MKIKYETQVREASIPIKRWLGRIEGIASGSRFETLRFQEYYDGSIASTYARLRLDREINDEEQRPTVELLIDQLVEGVSDLVENGDCTSSDALYKTLDGARVRGTTPQSIEFIAATIYKQHMPKKESTEYTLYTVLAIDWTPQSQPKQ